MRGHAEGRGGVRGSPEASVTGVPRSPRSLNWTVPVGVPTPGATGATVAVKVTDEPNVDGSVPPVSVTTVVVDASLTTWLTSGDVSPA